MQEDFDERLSDSNERASGSKMLNSGVCILSNSILFCMSIHSFSIL